MQTIKYRDPYANVRYGKAVDIVVLDEASPEGIEEVQKYLDGDYRRIKTDDRQYRRYNYSLEGIVYEGSEYGYRKTPEWICLHNERLEEILHRRQSNAGKPFRGHDAGQRLANFRLHDADKVRDACRLRRFRFGVHGDLGPLRHFF